MKTVLKIYLLAVSLIPINGATRVNAQTCATDERFATTTFARPASGAGTNASVATYSQNNWIGSGEGTIDYGPENVYFSDNLNVQTFTQKVRNVNLKGTGATFTMNFTSFNGNSLNFPYDGNQSDLTISYAGVVYATISTSNGSTTTGAGTISFLNGATNAVNGSAASYTFNLTPNGGTVVSLTLAVKLPVTIPNSGDFLVSFRPNANISDPRPFSDDFNVYTASLVSCPIVFSGSIFNDVNGLKDNLVNGSAVSIAGLQVALYDQTGNIVTGTTTSVKSDGTYSIPYSGTGTFTVRLLNLPPAYVNTGESSNGTGTAPDGAANGILSSYTTVDANTNTDKPNGNFGIEQAPETAVSSLGIQPNPGGNNVVTIPNSAFTTSTNGSPDTGDPAPGIISFIRITTFPANATGIVINGISYTSLATINVAFPNGLPTNASGAPTVTVGVNPVEGAVTVVLSIAAVDNAGVQDPTPGTITIPFSDALVSVGGTVWNDANGLTDAQVNGTGINTAGASPLYVSLYSGLTLISTLPVSADGSYRFNNLTPNSTYSIILGTNPVSNAVSAFNASGINGWVSVGEDCCDNSGGDGNNNGTLNITIGTGSLNNASFGIEHLPETDPKSTVIAQPTLNLMLILNGGANPPILSGSDPEDLPTGGVLSAKSVKITTAPANSELYYDNILVIAGTTITNFDASKFAIKFTSSSLGSTSTQFQYAYVDAAGMADPTPATYILTWDHPLPVTLISFDVKVVENQAQLTWMTSAEMNSAYFGVERSPDARSWNEIGQEFAAVTATAMSLYHFTDPVPATGTNYYRLKMADQDGTFAYSKILSVSLKKISITMYPNPVTTQLNLENIGFEMVDRVSVFNKSGAEVYINVGVIKHSINMTNMATGTYIVLITLKDGSRISKTIFKN